MKFGKCEKIYSIEYKEKDDCYWEVVTIKRKYDKGNSNLVVI